MLQKTMVALMYALTIGMGFAAGNFFGVMTYPDAIAQIDTLDTLDHTHEAESTSLIPLPSR
jgi:hypothetical protein